MNKMVPEPSHQMRKDFLEDFISITKRNELTRNNIGTKDDYLELLHYWLDYIQSKSYWLDYIQSKSYVIGNDELSREFFTSQ
jgi:hypothetical protein